MVMHNSAEHDMLAAHNVKMPTIVGILTFMSRKIAFSAYLSLRKASSKLLPTVKRQCFCRGFLPVFVLLYINKNSLVVIY